MQATPPMVNGAVIEGLMPPPHKGRGRRRTPLLRAVVNAIFYIVRGSG